MARLGRNLEELRQILETRPSCSQLREGDARLIDS
jgi:hypothetical protein